MSELEPRHYRRSESVAALAAAMVEVQGAIQGAKKGAENPHLRNKYADLESCWNACREPLTANGIAVLQLVTTADGKAVVTTTLLHKSGEFIESDLALPVQKNDAQGYGSAITYARRYGLCAAVGITPSDTEDDGERSLQRAEKKAPAAQKQGGNDYEKLLQSFADVKTKLPEEVYYAILERHGVKHANEFSDFAKARECYKALAEELKRTD